MICNLCGLQNAFFCNEGFCPSCCLKTFHGSCMYKQCLKNPVITVDIAEFSTETEKPKEGCGYITNIYNKGLLTLSQFKKIFFSNSKELSFPYLPQNNTSFSVIANPWVIPAENTHENNTGSHFYKVDDSSLTLIKNHKVQWCPNRTDLKQKWVYVYKIYKEGNGVKKGGEYGWVPKKILNKKLDTKYYNYNNLGGKSNKITTSPYFLNEKPFEADKIIFGNIKKDLKLKNEFELDMCSRASIHDQLKNLSFLKKDMSLKLNCGRSWQEIIDILTNVQSFNLLEGTNTILFSSLQNNYRTAEYIFKNSPITRVYCEIPAQDISCCDISYCEVADASLNNGIWTYFPYEWNLQVNTNYTVESSSQKFWKYRIVNVGDYISTEIDVKIYNDHPDVNNNTIKINYFCLIDKEPDNC